MIRSVRSVIFLGCLCCTAIPALPAAASDMIAPDKSRLAVFDPAKVWKVHIEIAATEHEAMQPRNRGLFGWLAAPKANPAEKPGAPARELHRNAFGMDLPWSTGTVTIDGQAFERIGIRYKGNGTIGDSARSIKKSYKLDLDHFGGSGKFYGMKTINLHSGVADPSKCRETVGYALYRAAGVPASRTGLAEVWLTVPGKHDKELLGVYTIVEPVDKAFLAEHFGDGSGLLMKPEGLRDLDYLSDDWERYKKQYVPKRNATPAEAKRMIELAKLVSKGSDDEFRAKIASYLDIDNYLRFLAATAFVSNSDNFFALGHNYYMYLNPKTGKVSFLPWDLDRSLANFPIFGSNKQQLDLSMVQPYAGAHRLTDRIMALSGMADRYRKLLAELASTSFAKDKLLKEVEALQAARKEIIARDAQAAAKRKDAGGMFGPVGMFGTPPDLKTFVEKRTASLAAQVAGTSRGHVPTGAFKMGDLLAVPIMEMTESGKDGMISKADWTGMAKRVFDTSAKDEQKRVTQKALADTINGMFPKPPDAGQGGPPPGFGIGNLLAGPIAKRADADKDGKLTLDELVATAEKLFDQFDKQKTGKLDEAAFAELLNTLLPSPGFGPPPPRPAAPKKDAGAEKKETAWRDGAWAPRGEALSRSSLDGCG